MKKLQLFCFFQKKLSIGLLHCDVMLFTHVNHAFCIMSGRQVAPKSPIFFSCDHFSKTHEQQKQPSSEFNDKEK